MMISGRCWTQIAGNLYWLGPIPRATRFSVFPTAEGETRTSSHWLDLTTLDANLILDLTHPPLLSSSDPVFTQASSWTPFVCNYRRGFRPEVRSKPDWCEWQRHKSLHFLNLLLLPAFSTVLSRMSWGLYYSDKTMFDAKTSKFELYARTHPCNLSTPQKSNNNNKKPKTKHSKQQQQQQQRQTF